MPGTFQASLAFQGPLRGLSGLSGAKIQNLLFGSLQVGPASASQGLQACFQILFQAQGSRRAPSKETKGLEPSPNPKWHSSGLDKSSLQTQIQLFKIGSIQSRRRLKKTKGLEPPPIPNRHPSGLDKSSLQTQIQLFKIGSNQSGHRLKKTKGPEPPPNPNRLDKSSLQTQIQLFKIGSIQSGHRLKKTKGLEPPPNPNWHLWS